MRYANHTRRVYQLIEEGIVVLLTSVDEQREAVEDERYYDVNSRNDKEK